MSNVKQKPAHVRLSGDITGDYVVRQRRRGGQLVIEPDVTAEEIRKELGARQATPEEFKKFVRAHDDELLPPDQEG